jgi:uncharacterized protein (DUF1330 family)
MKLLSSLRGAALAASLAIAGMGALSTSAAHAQTTSRPAIYVAEFEVTDMEGIKPYSANVESTFTPFGGRFIVRGGRLVSHEGPATKRIVMIEFPSFEQAEAWYDSPAYRELRTIRHRTATSKVYTVEELAR